MPEPVSQSPPNNDSLDDYIKDITGDRKPSADSITVEPGESGEDIDIPTSVNPEIREIVDTQTPKPELSQDEAVQNTRILMDMRESAQAFGLSYYVDGNLKSYEKYLYDRPQKENLIRAWSRIIQKANIRVSPWLDVIQAELFATGPLLVLATENRKMRKQLAAYQAQQEPNSTPVDTSEPYGRSDIKTLWKIDESGYFEFDLNRVRIPISKRKKKPNPTEQEVYSRLVKHNGEERVKEAFKI